jgi:hypothetical protein
VQTLVLEWLLIDKHFANLEPFETIKQAVQLKCKRFNKTQIKFDLETVTVRT